MSRNLFVGVEMGEATGIWGEQTRDAVTSCSFPHDKELLAQHGSTAEVEKPGVDGQKRSFLDFQEIHDD